MTVSCTPHPSRLRRNQDSSSLPRSFTDTRSTVVSVLRGYPFPPHTLGSSEQGREPPPPRDSSPSDRNIRGPTVTHRVRPQGLLSPPPWNIQSFIFYSPAPDGGGVCRSDPYPTPPSGTSTLHTLTIPERLLTLHIQHLRRYTHDTYVRTNTHSTTYIRTHTRTHTHSLPYFVDRTRPRTLCSLIGHRGRGRDPSGVGK